mmetsp:Transcript_26917/g.53012  ORF Transcript_26917/g.53012 Transcript_26917/m.53012 type:complete len:152 (+) Transcript_26917:352-807(+)
MPSISTSLSTPDSRAPWLSSNFCSFCKATATAGSTSPLYTTHHTTHPERERERERAAATWTCAAPCAGSLSEWGPAHEPNVGSYIGSIGFLACDLASNTEHDPEVSNRCNDSRAADNEDDTFVHGQEEKNTHDSGSAAHINPIVRVVHSSN